MFYFPESTYRLEMSTKSCGDGIAWEHGVVAYSWPLIALIDESHKYFGSLRLPSIQLRGIPRFMHCLHGLSSPNFRFLLEYFGGQNHNRAYHMFYAIFDTLNTISLPFSGGV